MTLKNLLLITCAVSLFGCAAGGGYSTHGRVKSQLRYSGEIKNSLFAKDNERLSQDAVDKIMSGTVVFPNDARMAIHQLDNNHSGIGKYYSYYGGYVSEEYLDLEQQYYEAISDAFLSNKNIREVKSIPSILTSKEPTLSELRESAVRMQSELMVIYSIESNVFTDINLFEKNEVKAYSTIEMILFHTQTGIIPFSDIITKRVLVKESKSDVDLTETRKRAENKAIIQSLQELAERVNSFLLKAYEKQDAKMEIEKPNEVQPVKKESASAEPASEQDESDSITR